MRKIIGGILVWALVWIAFCYMFAPRVKAQATPSLRLTQISDREWVDLSKVSFVRLPVTVPSDPSCAPNCQTRWGGDFIVDGVQVAYSEDAEKALRRMLAEGSR